jgi:hypothetical protein
MDRFRTLKYVAADTHSAASRGFHVPIGKKPNYWFKLRTFSHITASRRFGRHTPVPIRRTRLATIAISFAGCTGLATWLTHRGMAEWL